MRHPTLTWIWDNFEAFAVAIALALVIRHFCIEAFRIPTGSMNPTLHGDDPDRGLHGDRILVDKTIWELRAPRRFEVAVFRFPLNTNKNYIKRIAGLPGEWLRLVDGDVWTSADQGATWAIARKSAGVRDQLFFPYWPEPVDDRDAFRNMTCWDATGGFRAGAEGETEFLIEPTAGEESRLEFNRGILPYNLCDAAGERRDSRVGDVRLSFRFKGGGGALSVHLMEHGRDHRLVLGPDESFAEVAGAIRHRVPLKTRLREGEEIDVSFANVDDTLVVDLPEDGTLEIEDPNSGTSYPTAASLAVAGSRGRHAVYLEAGPGLAGRLTEMRLDRDLAYDAENRDGLGGETWEVPAGHYFMLGDNTLSSLDSRKWVVNHTELKDGTIIEWDAGGRDDNNPTVAEPFGGESAVLTVNQDVNGLIRRFSGGQVADSRTQLPKCFVPEDHLIGRAFAVFWPIYASRIYSGPTRVKIIR